VIAAGFMLGIDVLIMCLLRAAINRSKSNMSKLTDALNALSTDVTACGTRVSADLQNTFSASDLALVASIDASVNAIDPAPAPTPTPTPTPSPTPTPTPSA